MPRKVGKKNLVRKNNVKITFSVKHPFFDALNHISGATFAKKEKLKLNKKKNFTFHSVT